MTVDLMLTLQTWLMLLAGGVWLLVGVRRRSWFPALMGGIFVLFVLMIGPDRLWPSSPELRSSHLASWAQLLGLVHMVFMLALMTLSFTVRWLVSSWTLLLMSVSTLTELLTFLTELQYEALSVALLFVAVFLTWRSCRVRRSGQEDEARATT